MNINTLTYWGGGGGIKARGGGGKGGRGHHDNTWSRLPEITPAFEKFGNISDADLVTDDDFAQIQKFFCYSVQSNNQHR